MFNFNYITKKDIKRHNHNPNWPHIPDNLYRKLIVRRSGSGKTNAFLNLISYHPDTDKVCLHAFMQTLKSTIKLRKKNIDHIWWYDCWYA